MAKRKFRPQGGIPSSLAIGVGISAASFILLSVISSFIISATPQPLRFANIGAFAALLISGAVAGFITARLLPERKILYSLISALLFSLLMLAVGLIMARGGISGGVFLNYLSYILTSLLFAWLGSRERKRHR